jgi:hypothetical protein
MSGTLLRLWQLFVGVGCVLVAAVLAAIVGYFVSFLIVWSWVEGGTYHASDVEVLAFQVSVKAAVLVPVWLAAILTALAFPPPVRKITLRVGIGLALIPTIREVLVILRVFG